ncbi:MAG TPA: hypothetical protein DCM86_03430 [Verrucomicrobiales bacterium]|nr:hypothetical protein [Verrucomicrobiales bacterium]
MNSTLPLHAVRRSNSQPSSLPRTLSSAAMAWVLGLLALGLLPGRAPAREKTPEPRDPRIQVRLVTTVSDPSHPCRIAKDPRNNTLYYLTLGGGIYRVGLRPGDGLSTTTLVADSRDHGETNAMGFAIDRAGTFYLVGNHVVAGSNAFTFARILRGTERAGGASGRQWSVVARTEDYARSQGAYDHLFNGVEVSPDGALLYVNSGSRTDHGEVQEAQGAFPGLREDPLTSLILRIPANSTDLVLPRDRGALKAAGWVYCEGVRNTYDLRFSPQGELFGPDNGPDRSVSDELNWLQEGHHYGFPWRMGGADNPQQFSGYDPAGDKLLDVRFGAVKAGEYRNDPTFPPSPGGMTEPILNRGPDADKYRDPADGKVKDASDTGVPIATFTAHRSPLGLVFDETGSMAAPYTGSAFVMSFMAGDETGETAAGPFLDGSNDLLHLQLHRVGDRYETEVHRLVTGLGYPVDAEVIENRIYVICYGFESSLWEITLPSSRVVALGEASWNSAGFGFHLNASGPGPVSMQTSSNLLDWTPLWDLELPSGTTFFLDGAASPASPARFYRTLSR